MLCERCHEDLGEGGYYMDTWHVKGQEAERCPKGLAQVEQQYSQARGERFREAQRQRTMMEVVE